MKAPNRADQILRELRQKGSVSLDALIESLLGSGGSGPGRELELVACGRRGVATFTLRGRSALLPWRHRTLRECLLEPTAG